MMDRNGEAFLNRAFPCMIYGAHRDTRSLKYTGNFMGCRVSRGRDTAARFAKRGERYIISRTRKRERLRLSKMANMPMVGPEDQSSDYKQLRAGEPCPFNVSVRTMFTRDPSERDRYYDGFYEADRVPVACLGCSIAYRNRNVGPAESTRISLVELPNDKAERLPKPSVTGLMNGDAQSDEISRGMKFES